MRYALIAAAGVGLALVAALILFLTGAVDFGVTIGACQRDKEIDASLRDGASKAAADFYAAMLNGDSETSYNALSPELQKTFPRADFDAVVARVKDSGPLTDLEPAHSYKPSIIGRPGRSVCGGGDTAVIVSALPDVTQVHEVMSAKTGSNSWALSAWMVQDGETWRVRKFYTSLASMAGHDAAALFDLAKAQAKAGNAFNAMLLYVGAGTIAERGPDIELAVQKQIADALAAHTPPADLKGKAPFTWTFDDATYTVEGVTLTAAQDQLGIVLTHRDQTWDGKDEAAATERNKKLIDGFTTKHPEYAEAFGLVVARIVSADGSATFDTVFDKASGFAEPVAPGTAEPVPATSPSP